MADNTDQVEDVKTEATEPTVETKVETPVETPVETEDTFDETDLEDDDTSFDDEVDEDEVEEEEPEEEEKSEPEETEAEADNEEEPEEEDTTPEVKKGEPDPSKARDAYIERKVRREEQDKREKENLDRYLAEAQDDEQELEKRKFQVESHNLQKEKSQLNSDKLAIGIERAAKDIELIKSGSPEVQEAIAEALDDFEAMNVVRNQNGDVVEIKGDVYQYLQKKADSISRLTNIGARQQADAKSKIKASTMPIPSKAPRKPKADPDLDGFDEEAGRW
jgi:hypothetical protein